MLGFVKHIIAKHTRDFSPCNPEGTTLASQAEEAHQAIDHLHHITSSIQELKVCIRLSANSGLTSDSSSILVVCTRPDTP